MNPIFDSLRNRFVKRTPEEEVRQFLLHQMIHEFGYPKGQIAIERELSAFCDAKIKRRFDIVCFSPKDFRPLLLIECKAESVTEEAKAQLMGYNAYIKAPYLCIAAKKKIVTGFYNCQRGEYEFLEGFLRYDTLL